MLLDTFGTTISFVGYTISFLECFFFVDYFFFSGYLVIFSSILTGIGATSSSSLSEASETFSDSKNDDSEPLSDESDFFSSTFI